MYFANVVRLGFVFFEKHAKLETNNMPAHSCTESINENELLEQVAGRSPHIPKKVFRKRLIESMVIPAMMINQAEAAKAAKAEAAKALKIETVCGEETE